MGKNSNILIGYMVTKQYILIKMLTEWVYIQWNITEPEKGMTF